jgi:hypothetical protein
LSSVDKWGGTAEDYLPIHSWLDASKEFMADSRHRALRHHSQGVFEAERVFGVTITLQSGRVVPVRAVAEQHVREDIGWIPTLADWLSRIERATWMDKPMRLEKQLEPVPECTTTHP